MEKAKIIKRSNRVINTDKEFLKQGIVAFEVITIAYGFFNNKMESELDTRIYQDGRQVIIDGDGFFPMGTDVTYLNN